MIIKYIQQIANLVSTLALLASFSFFVPYPTLVSADTANQVNCDPSSATNGCCATGTPAADCTAPKTYDAKNPLATDQAATCDANGNGCGVFDSYLTKAINLGSALVGLVVVTSIIIGGIQFSSSGGDPQKAANARNRIRNSVIALVAFIFLFSFLQFLIPGGLFHG